MTDPVAARRLHRFRLLFILGLAFLVVRTLLDSRFANSALLYLAVPFGISILLSETVPRSEGRSVGARYFNHLRDATVIFLATSAFLFEGFICVLMFMPIYLFAVTVGFGFALAAERRRGGSPGLHAYVIPALVLLLSLEGTAEPLTAPRDEVVTARAVLAGSVEVLQANMARPIAFGGQRHWFLSLFPSPTRVEAGTLREGDVHRVDFTYPRWFVANLHQGTMRLRLAEVSRDRIRTEVVEDTSYLSHYLRVTGTEVRFAELGEDRTEVSLTVRYRRLLDPSWYFGPLERFAVARSAAYLIESVIARPAPP